MLGLDECTTAEADKISAGNFAPEHPRIVDEISNRVEENQAIAREGRKLHRSSFVRAPGPKATHAETVETQASAKLPRSGGGAVVEPWWSRALSRA